MRPFVNVGLPDAYGDRPPSKEINAYIDIFPFVLRAIKPLKGGIG